MDALGSRGLWPYVSSGTSKSGRIEPVVEMWEIDTWLGAFTMWLDAWVFGVFGDGFLASAFRPGLPGAEAPWEDEGSACLKSCWSPSSSSWIIS